MKSSGGKSPSDSGSSASAGEPPRSPQKPPSPSSPAQGAAASSPENALAQRIHALEEERDRLKAEIQDVRDKFLRARADYENLVRRTSKEAADSIRAAKGSLLLRFASIAESLERAAGEPERGAPDHARGLKMVHDEFRKLMREEGLKEIDALGHMFNYQHHQAVERVETADRGEGTIVEVIQRGYLLGGQVLRPALVKVAVPPKKAPNREAAPGTA